MPNDNQNLEKTAEQGGQVDVNVRQLINDAFKLNGQGGVITLPLINGDMMTNYVPWRKYFRTHE